MSTELSQLLELAAADHGRLCPRQVLGVRIGLAGVAALQTSAAGSPLQLLVILETDGCFVDGVGAATGCTVGKRSLRIEDYGKVAATFVNMRNEHAVRVAPRAGIRQRAYAYAPGESRRYFAQLHGYQVMPDAELLTIQRVHLLKSVAEIMSRAGVRVDCAACGEEIINEREVYRGGMVLCRACAGAGYYVAACDRDLPLEPQPAHPRALTRNGRRAASALRPITTDPAGRHAGD